MRVLAFLTAIILPPLAFAQGMDGYDASKGLGSPTYKTKAPPAAVEAETIIENSDVVIKHAQDVLSQLDTKAGAPPPPRKPSSSEGLPQTASNNASRLELNFEPEQTTLEDLQKSDILEQIFAPLQETSGMRVFILSHAASPDKQQSASRRTSLKRALAVQEFLESKGIETAKVIVMPMGNTVQNADRIHLELSRL